MYVSIAQLEPVWLNKNRTIEKIISAIEQVATEKSDLIVFGETLLPGYPFWIELTDGAKFESDIQKEFYSKYLTEAVDIKSGGLSLIQKVAKDNKIAVYIGVAERATDRGGHSVYCSLVYINKLGEIKSVHRKLMPTYEERLYWATGDGNGLRTHKLEEFTVGGLNCWENWMPMARASLYAQNENLHVAVWPGNEQNTIDLTRHIARENRMYVMSASGFYTKANVPKNFPNYELLMQNAPDIFGNGGSCIAAPDGSWIIEPTINGEFIKTVEIDLNFVRRERQNFDPSGHYSRPDVLKLTLNQERQSVLTITE
jgi:nitrilase